MTNTRLIEGKNYTVLYDGTEYSCECFNVMDMFNCVGNTLFAGISDNGIPFIFVEDADGLILGQSCFVCMTMDEDDPSSVQTLTHNIQLSFEGLITKKIPAIYLDQPNWSINDKTNGGYIKNRPFGDLLAGTVVVEETVSCNSDGMGFFTELRIGTHAYIVEFDGVTYELTGVASGVNGGEQIELSYNDNNGIAFSIVKNYYNVAYNILSAAEGLHTVKITLAEDVIEKIDTKYLPDDIGGSSLPEVTTSDAGKFLRVSSSGEWIAETIPNAEEVKF